MNQHCPLKDSSACKHPSRTGVCSACYFDFETLDPDEGMFRLRRENAENVFVVHAAKTMVVPKQIDAKKISADAAHKANPKAELAKAKKDAARAKALTLKAAANPAKPQYKTGHIFRHELLREDGSVIGHGPEMVIVPRGLFNTGARADEPSRRYWDSPVVATEIKQPFAMGVTPVTVGQYKQYLSENPPGFFGRLGDLVKYLFHFLVLNKQTDEHPVILKTYNEAKRYIAWLNKVVGTKEGVYRLPGEAEWEYAAHADTTTPFHFGQTINTTQANFDGRKKHYPGTTSGQYRGCTTPVKTFEPNDFGLYDIHGNVSEWCEDIYNRQHHIDKGGHWRCYSAYTRIASRGGWEVGACSDTVGFRLARTVFFEPEDAPLVSSGQTSLNPMAAWPFPTASKP